MWRWMQPIICTSHMSLCAETGFVLYVSHHSLWPMLLIASHLFFGNSLSLPVAFNKQATACNGRYLSQRDLLCVTNQRKLRNLACFARVLPPKMIVHSNLLHFVGLLCSKVNPGQGCLPDSENLDTAFCPISIGGLGKEVSWSPLSLSICVSLTDNWKVCGILPKYHVSSLCFSLTLMKEVLQDEFPAKEGVLALFICLLHL